MKQLMLVAAIAMLIIKQINGQKSLEPCVTQYSKNVIMQFSIELKLTYPLNMKKASVLYGYGSNKLVGTSCNFKNEGITFLTTLNEPVLAVLDGIVSSYFVEDNVYTIFIKKYNYTMVYSNLKNIKVKNGDYIKQGDKIGNIAADELNSENGILDFMFFENNAIVNPEKYFNKSVQPIVVL
jgi:murein DD-endopeptidase MepM/ murein hydrolase activator NlpD